MAFINNVGPAGPTEGELYRYLVDLTRKAEETCRQMAHKRGDTRWLELGRVAFGEKCRGAIARLDTATGLRGTLVLPENYRRPNWH